MADRRGAGAVVGGICFIVPAVVTVLALSALFLAASAPARIRGAAAGAGAAVPAGAAAAAVSLIPASWNRARSRSSAGPRRDDEASGRDDEAPAVGPAAGSDEPALARAGGRVAQRARGWQVAVLAAALGWLLVLRRGVVVAIVGAAACGVIVTLPGLR